MPLLASILFGFVPMFFFAFFIYWLDRYEKEPKALLTTVFFWGVIVAAGGAFIINTVLGVGVYLFTGSEVATELDQRFAHRTGRGGNAQGAGGTDRLLHLPPRV